MATLVLGIAGGALGSAFGPAGAILGRAAGALAGYTLDQALFGTRKRIEGPRLSDLEVQASSEGAVIPRVYGRARLAGQIIWATDFEEVRQSETQGGFGGKGAGRRSRAPNTAILATSPWGSQKARSRASGASGRTASRSTRRRSRSASIAVRRSRTPTA